MKNTLNNYLYSDEYKVKDITENDLMPYFMSEKFVYECIMKIAEYSTEKKERYIELAKLVNLYYLGALSDQEYKDRSNVIFDISEDPSHYIGTIEGYVFTLLDGVPVEMGSYFAAINVSDALVTLHKIKTQFSGSEDPYKAQLDIIQNLYNKYSED